MGFLNPEDRLFKLMHKGAAYKDFRYKNRQLRIYNVNIYEARGTVEEIFIDEVYKGLDVAGRQVVDAGASIGDTAIYFMLNGARAVYSFEPVKARYELALKNIKQNSIGGIELFNGYLGSDRSKPAGNVPVGTRTYSLDDITKRFGIKDGY